MSRAPVCRHGFDLAAAACRRLSGLITIFVASACSRTELGIAGEDYRGAGQDAAEVVAAPNGGSPPFTGEPDPAQAEPTGATDSGPPGSAAAADDGCSASVLPYRPPDTAFAACWGCAAKGCSSQLAACVADCACNTALAGALACLDRGGGPECFTSLPADGDPSPSALGQCLLFATLECGCGGAPVPDASTCTLIGSGSGSAGNGECESNFGETCGGTNYQAVCACPEGNCVCFSGVSTHVVSFTGCPYCPGGPGPGSSGFPVGPPMATIF